MLIKFLFFISLFFIFSCGQASEAPQQALDNSNRIIAIGDIHSDIGVMQQVFQLAGATNENDEWIGGELTIVQMGDLIGRSDDEREVLDFMFAIQAQAEQHGGKVHALIGNHEVMGGRVDNQAVGPNPFPAYVGMPDLNLDDPRLQRLPPNERSRGAALMSGGPYAVRIAEFPTVLKLGETIFVHGGVVPRWAEYGIERINVEVSAWLRGETNEPDSSQRVDDSDRVMWARHFSSRVDQMDCLMLEESLRILGVKRMIVAHTRHAEITSYCGNKIWATDVGMSRAYGGQIQILELIDDEVTGILSFQ
ncbi:MAG: calcineurin [SAR86 cluster bacterium]|uniref:Calcineurin n=1 Tax=SAR86 cluster bacterium TaxID=2030880 RepID=A0A2A5CIZ3_9GAMM|nr:metallophosphoesterase [Gammaproteobacteria bacterium AH-315-E17]PCJ43471.1 MAG: calcineurin [SAR86 cluster bacterium]